MATAASRALSPTWLSRARRTARNASTACRRRSGRSARPTTTFWSRRRRGRWTSRPGWTGSWAVWAARSTTRKTTSAPSSPRRRFWERCAERRPQRAPAPGPQPPARWLRGQAHDVEIRQAHQVLPGHRPPRHSAAGREWNSGPQPGRRAQHQLFPRAGTERLGSGAGFLASRAVQAPPHTGPAEAGVTATVRLRIPWAARRRASR